MVWEGFREMVEMFNPIWCAVVVKNFLSYFGEVGNHFLGNYSADIAPLATKVSRPPPQIGLLTD